MLRGDALGAGPLASSGVRSIAAQSTGPLLQTVRTAQAGAVAAHSSVIVPTRP